MIEIEEGAMNRSSNLHTGYVEVNQARFYYEIAGAGKPLVLLHAGITDRRMWDEQFQIFAQHAKTIRYDVRGYGQSSLGEGDYTRSQDLAALLQALNIEQAILLGCSQGGTTAIDFALEQPAMTTALILVSASPSGQKFTGEMPPRLQALMAAYQQHDLTQSAELATQIWFDGPQRQPEQMSPVLRTQVRAMIRDVLSAGAMDMTGDKFAHRPAVDHLTEIAVPTLVIVGDHDDPSVLKAGETLASTIPGVEKAVIPNTAHLLNMEKPAVFNQLVLDFLQKWELSA